MEKLRVPFNEFRTINISKRPWNLIAILLIGLILIYGTFVLYEEITRPQPMDAIQQGLAKTINARSYRYEVTAVHVIDGKEKILSNTRGEKCLQDVHIKAELPIIKADVEIYQIGDTMYRQDTTTKDWLIVSNKGRAAIEMLISEINPLGVFHFDEFIEVIYTGKEKVNKRKCWAYEIMAKGENKFLELYWKDFNYQLWIDKKEGMIRKAVVTAEHRDKSQHILKVNVLLYDFDESIEIVPPIN